MLLRSRHYQHYCDKNGYTCGGKKVKQDGVGSVAARAVVEGLNPWEFGRSLTEDRSQENAKFRNLRNTSVTQNVLRRTVKILKQN